MRKICLYFLLILIGHNAQSQIDLLTWESTGLAGSEASFASNFNVAGLGASTITRGAGLTAAANGNRINATSWGITANANDAVTGNDYFEFTVTPVGGSQFSVTQLVFNYERSATGPPNFIVRSSIDGYTSNIGSISGLAAAITTGNTIVITGVSSQTSAVTFRIYGYGATGTAGSGGFENAVGADFIVRGTAGAGNSASVAPGTTAAEPNTDGTFNVTLSNVAPTGGVTVTYTLTDVPGGATLGVDYTNPQAGTIVIPEGSTTGVVDIDVIDDGLFEGTETISITLNSASNGFAIGTGSASLNLLDNDSPPTVSVSPGTNAAEPATNGTFTISFSTPTNSSTDINYNFTGTAGFGTDYTVSYSTGTASTSTASGTLTVPTGTTSVTVTATPVNDIDVEASETITLTLSAPTNGYVLGTASGSINITSEDIPPFAPISLTDVYSQDFNTLANAGIVNNLTIQGWLMNETGGSARDNDQYGADNGGSNTGDTYSYGAVGATERALGSLQSGTLISTYGSAYTNNSGVTINKLRITYTGEQWRLGATGRNDRLEFQYSTNATSLVTGTWTDVDQLDFIAPNGVGTVGSLVGNLDANRVTITFDVTELNIPSGAVFYIRWNDGNASGADDGLAIDDFSIEVNPLDLIPPAIASLSPANNATDVSLNGSASIVFNEPVQKLTGTITIRNSGDNSIFQTIDVSSSTVTLSGASVSFPLSGLASNSNYFIEISNGAFEDLSGNDFAGFTGNGTWSFATGTTFYAANFNNCSSSLADGFTQYSVTGSIVWACTPFGRDPAAPAGTTAFPTAIQINGFSGGTNVPNNDWLISPSFNLVGTTYPLLSFWSRTAFNGPPLLLKVSTDYTGGDPSLATWTDLNGKFPAQTSNIWTLSSDINLSAYKQPNVHFAFIYSSSDDDGARWTVDDVSLVNSPTPPPPSLTVGTTDIQFTYVASGATADKTFTFTGNDLTGDVTITSNGDFLVSRNGTSFGTSVTYTQAEANDIQQTVYIRFAPTQPNQNFKGTISISTSGLSETINLTGTSIDPATTLEVVNWNIEWFGSTDPTLGPTNDNLQEQNVRTILQNTAADIYGLVEVVDEARLASVVNQMPGYTYVISNFSSHTNTSANPPGNLAQAQKLAFVYKTSVFSNVTTEALLSQGINSAADLSNPAYNYFSSGRFPYMMSADVTLNCVTKRVRFILIHAKANTSPTATSYARRKNGSDTLHYTLNTLYPNDNILILGDINDDLDRSITAGFTTTSWDAFTTDEPNYDALTLPLSLAGKKSTVSYNDVIDHVIVSEELGAYYMPATASILSDVTSQVNNYANTTSDHFPVFTRYKFDAPPAPVISCPGDIVKTNDAGVCGAIVEYTVTYSGNCGSTTLQQIEGMASGSVFPVGTTTNTYVVTDAAGGTDTCSFNVVVTDTENPTITCPEEVKAGTDAGLCSTVVNYTIPFSDNCTGATIQQTGGLPSGSSFAIGSTTNTFIVTDASGNTATCAFIVTVTDDEAPTFTKPADITIAFNTTCGYNAATSTTGNVTNESDNCSAGIEATYTDEVTTCGNTVTIRRTWQLVDLNGNTAPSQVQTITVTDNNSTYVVYATKEARFDEYNYVNGSVGVSGIGGKAEFKRGTIMPSPYFARAQTVSVHSQASVPNRIQSPATDGPNPPFFTFSGNTSGLPSRTISTSTAVPVSANYKDLKIKKDVTVTITGTLYGKIDIEEGADVTFAPTGGILNIEYLKIVGDNNNATIIRFGGCTSVRIRDKVEIEEFTHLNPGGQKVTFYVGDNSSDDEFFTVSGSANIITANIYIKEGELRVKNDFNLLNGWFITERLYSEGRFIVWNDNNCNTPAESTDYFTRNGFQAEGPAAEEATNLKVVATPNPSTDYFNLRIEGKAGVPVTLRILDISGKPLRVQSNIAGNSTVRTGDGLTSGIYFAEVIQGNEKKVIKLVKLK
ncbi:MAG: HYR domain-containing protein [Chitinophagaceae bacterium]|nr:HYR domain-containing protein [Chitinophagaceae bacterium]